jgi:hypothetical protein
MEHSVRSLVRLDLQVLVPVVVADVVPVVHLLDRIEDSTYPSLDHQPVLHDVPRPSCVRVVWGVLVEVAAWLANNAATPLRIARPDVCPASAHHGAIDRRAAVSLDRLLNLARSNLE